MSFLTTLMNANGAQPLQPQTCADLLHKMKSQFTAGPDHPEKPMRIQGQDELVHRLVMAVVMNEHVLLEGLPGVAKTTAVEMLAKDSGLCCRRIQFVPDMQPSDLIGKDQIKLSALTQAAASGANFRYWENGPLFQNIVIADEINRAPAKVQAALLESMAERAITPFGKTRFVIRARREWQMWVRWIFSAPAYRNAGVWGSLWPVLLGHDTLPAEGNDRVLQALCEQEWDAFGPAFPWAERKELPEETFGASPVDLRNPRDVQFTVFATMNPIEQEGTYPLSEAQTDRFCFKTIVRYPSYDALQAITRMVNPPQQRRDPDEALLHDAATGDAAMRRSLYFFRRCREVAFGPPGQQADALLDRAFLRPATGEKTSAILDYVTRIVFYSHMRQAESGSRRGQQLAQLLKDPEQIERQARLLREDQAYAAVAEHDIWQFVKSGASPRAQLFLAKAAISEYLLDGCPGERVVPDHVARVAHDVLRHRVRLNVQAHVRGMHTDDLVDLLLRQLMEKKASP
jgi:MoxR-like ATPase